MASSGRRVAFGVGLGRFFRMVLGVKRVGVGHMRMMRRLFVVAGFVMLGGFVMVLGGVFVVFGGFLVVLAGFL